MNELATGDWRITANNALAPGEWYMTTTNAGSWNEYQTQTFPIQNETQIFPSQIFPMENYEIQPSSEIFPAQNIPYKVLYFINGEWKEFGESVLEVKPQKKMLRMIRIEE